MIPDNGFSVRSRIAPAKQICDVFMKGRAWLMIGRKGRLEKAKEFLDKGFLTQDEYNQLEKSMDTENDFVPGAC